jgi:hypothetical protein
LLFSKQRTGFVDVYKTAPLTIWVWLPTAGQEIGLEQGIATFHKIRAPSSFFAEKGTFLLEFVKWKWP